MDRERERYKAEREQRKRLGKQAKLKAKMRRAQTPGLVSLLMLATAYSRFNRLEIAKGPIGHGRKRLEESFQG